MLESMGFTVDLLNLKLDLRFSNNFSSFCSEEIISLRAETTFCIFGRSSGSCFQHSN